MRDGSKFLIIIIKITTPLSPLRIFLPASCLYFLLGLTNYSMTRLTRGRFTNMSALLFITSVIVFMTGLVSEQITQLRFDRVKVGR